MDIQEYSTLALRTASEDGDHMVHAALGMAGESGEVADITKKVRFYGKPLDRNHMIEEIGDVCWYINLLIVSLGTTWDKVLDANIAKLEKRYPNLRFDANHAINRDKDAENAAMATVPSRRRSDKVEG